MESLLNCSLLLAEDMCPLQFAARYNIVAEEAYICCRKI